jgi:hypothetical protein
MEKFKVIAGIQGTFQPNFLSNGSVVSEEDKVFFT